MRQERIKALVLAALIASEIIPIDGVLIERASKALDRAAATLMHEACGPASQGITPMHETTPGPKRFKAAVSAPMTPHDDKPNQDIDA